MSGAAPPEIAVDVCHAEAARAIVQTYRLRLPATVADALELAVADPAFAGVEIRGRAVGVFGRIAALDQALHDGDRIELYRPLTADPKTARRARARELAKKRRQ